MVRFVLDDDKVYKVVAESDDAIWFIDYDNPCAPKMVKQDGLVNLEEIPVPDDYMQESVVSRAIYDTAKKRLGILSAILSDNAYITNAALRQRAIAKIAQDARVSQKTLKRWYYSYLAYQSNLPRRENAPVHIRLRYSAEPQCSPMPGMYSKQRRR